MSADRQARRLLRILEDERAALIRGDLKTPIRLGARKTDLAERLERDPPPAGLLEAIRVAAAHNAMLLRAALDGIKAARARAASIREGGAIRTYSAHGGTAQIAPSRGTLHRRA